MSRLRVGDREDGEEGAARLVALVRCERPFDLRREWLDDGDCGLVGVAEESSG